MIQRWRHRDTPPLPALVGRREREWSILDPVAYCYLLGAFLGDGTVSQVSRRCWALRIVNDQRYPDVTHEILNAMRVVFSDATSRMWPSYRGASHTLEVVHPAIQRAFPQHGPGRKHTRPIELADWQRELTQQHPGALIRGLIHSDGCRCLNHVKTTLPSGRVAEYRYVRYFFTNHSADIRAIFAEHCGLLGVRVTQPNHRNLAVSHRASVAILEEVVGPKH